MARFHCLPTETPSEMSAAMEAKSGCSCPKITLARYHHPLLRAAQRTRLSPRRFLRSLSNATWPAL